MRIWHASWMITLSAQLAMATNASMSMSAVGGIALDGPERVLVACRQQDLRGKQALSLVFDVTLAVDEARAAAAMQDKSSDLS